MTQDALSNHSVVPKNYEENMFGILQIFTSKAVAIVGNVYISGMHLQMIEAFPRMSRTIV
jgi:hypothetical protein